MKGLEFRGCCNFFILVIGDLKLKVNLSRFSTLNHNASVWKSFQNHDDSWRFPASLSQKYLLKASPEKIQSSSGKNLDPSQVQQCVAAIQVEGGCTRHRVACWAIVALTSTSSVFSAGQGSSVVTQTRPAAATWRVRWSGSLSGRPGLRVSRRSP